MSKKKIPVETEFKGLMVLQCPSCGEVFTRFSPDVVTTCYCRGCNSKFVLTGTPIPLVSYCECGNRIRAVTNSTSDILEFNCKCGYPLAAEYSSHKHKYFGLR